MLRRIDFPQFLDADTVDLRIDAFAQLEFIVQLAAEMPTRDTPEVSGGFWTPGAAMGHKLIKRLADNAGLTFAVE